MKLAPTLFLLSFLTGCGAARTEPLTGGEDATATATDATVDGGVFGSEDAAEADAAEVLDASTSPDAEAPDASAPDAEVAIDAGAPELPPFSFFVTSIEKMRELSGSQDGFGGDLRFGQATGLEGADEICRQIAESSMPGSGAKVWRAFLSASTGGANGGPTHAIDRVGQGPWYDRNGRLVATNLAGLRMTRPQGDAQLVNDLPNERGESQQQQPNPAGGTADNHDVLTGSDAQGRFASASPAATCNDWTSVEPQLGRPMLGHSWPARSGQSWMRAHPAAGCAAVVNLVQNGPGAMNCYGVGCGGGYGAIYCFALVP